MNNIENPNICIIIPTFNESKTMNVLLESINNNKELVQIRLIIVDDGSTDGTLEIIQDLSKKYGNITLIERGMKKGFGTAIRDGFKCALGLTPFPDLIITMDGDLSHNPDQLIKLTKTWKRNSIVVGSRYIKGGEINNWGIYRKILSWGANFLSRVFINIPVSDSTSGYRCYGVLAVKEILPNLESEGFEIQIEILSEAKRLGYSIHEEPIIFWNRTEGESKLKFKEIWTFVKKIYILSKKTDEWKRVLKFCIVGISGIVINETILWALTEIWGLYYLISSVVSTEFAIINIFFLNEIWTFRDTYNEFNSDIIKRLLKFHISRFGSLILGILVLVFLTEILNIGYLYSNIISILILMTYNYLCSKGWVWT